MTESSKTAENIDWLCDKSEIMYILIHEFMIQQSFKHNFHNSGRLIGNSYRNT